VLSVQSLAALDRVSFLPPHRQRLLAFTPKPYGMDVSGLFSNLHPLRSLEFINVEINDTLLESVTL
jgi:hypothetical protein